MPLNSAYFLFTIYEIVFHNRIGKLICINSLALPHTRAISIKTRANEFQRKYFLFQSNYSIYLYPAFKKNLNKSKDIVIARMSICSLMFLMEKFSFLSTVFVFASFSQPSEAYLNCWPCDLPSTWHIFFFFLFVNRMCIAKMARFAEKSR